MDLDAFASCLDDERALLERLLFKLEEEHLVLASGRHRWLDPASAEVLEASEALEVAERRRLALSDALVGELGLPVSATLRDIADTLPAPDGEVLRAHRQEMRHLLDRVQDLVERNRDLIARGLAGTADALAMLGAAPVAAYDASGTQAAHVAGDAAWMFDGRA